MNISNSKASLRQEYDYSPVPVQASKRSSLIRAQSNMQIHTQTAEARIQHAEDHLQGTRCRNHCALFTGIAIVVAGVLAGVGYATWYFTRTTYFETHEVLGHIQINAQNRSGSLFTSSGSGALPSFRVGEGTFPPLQYSGSCSLDDQKSVIKGTRHRYVCLQYGHESTKTADYRLVVQTLPADNADSSFQCYNVRWDFPAKDSLRDCYSLRGAKAYGGGLRRFQTWPANNQPIFNQSVVHDPASAHGYSSLVSPYYLFSSGLAFFGNASQNTIVVNLNNTSSQDSEFCIGTDATNVGTTQSFSYTMCFGNNMTHVHRNFLKKQLDQNIPALDEKIIRNPIWTTMSMAIDTEGRLSADAIDSLADMLMEQEFPISQLVIDTRWESLPGEDTFNTEMFPDPGTLFASLKNRGIEGRLMLHPFVASRASSFATATAQNFLAKDPGSGNLLPVSSWTGEGFQLNTTSSGVVNWKSNRAKTVLQYQTSPGCVFLGGVTGWTSSVGQGATTSSWRDLHATFPVAARKICGDGVQTEISTGFTRQILRMAYTPVAANMTAEESMNAQLRALIPKALTIGLLGHPIFVPVSVGGNPFMDEKGHLDVGPNAESRYPDHDRFLRWLGVVLFMPVIEFAISPSYYYDTPKVSDYVKSLLKIREKNMDYIIYAARAALQTGEPLIRPMWWSHPTDRNTWNIEDQYFVGDDLIVAPILLQGAVTRAVYLPEGNWVNPQGGVERGGLVDAIAGLDEIPFYFRQR